MDAVCSSKRVRDSWGEDMKEILYKIGIFAYNTGKVVGFRFSSTNERAPDWPYGWLFYRIHENGNLKECWEGKVTVSIGYDCMFSVRL